MIDAMDADPFLSPKLKIERAERHFDELEAAAKDFWKTNPYRTFVEKDMDARQLVYKLRVLKTIPPSFAAIVGDAVQNLRASLDHAACCLALQKNPAVNINDIAFPIAGDVHEFEALARKKIKKLTPEAIAFIKALKPYKGGNDAFWRLHRLGIRDRHRLLIVTWTAYGSTGITTTLPFPKTGEKIQFPTIFLQPVVNYFEPLEDGSELFRCPIPPANCPVEEKVHIRIHIAFSDGEVVMAEPINPALLQLRDFVKDVIAKIETRFFR